MSEVTPADGTPSRRPYLLRAMHEWMIDAGYTPHLIVDATCPDTRVPAAYIKDGKIVLNVSMGATQRLQLQNHCVEFDARFGGVVHHIYVPIGAVLGIYARETGEGMVFNESGPEAPPPGESVAPPAAPTGVDSAESRRARFKVVK